MPKFFVVNVSTHEVNGKIFDHNYLLENQIFKNIYGLSQYNTGWQDLQVGDYLVFYTTKKTVTNNSQHFVAMGKVGQLPYKSNNPVFIGDGMYCLEISDLHLPKQSAHYKNIAGLSWQPDKGTVLPISQKDYWLIWERLFKNSCQELTKTLVS